MREQQPSNVCESRHAAYNSFQHLHLSEFVLTGASRSFRCISQELCTFWESPALFLWARCTADDTADVFMWVEHLQTNIDTSTPCYCRDAALLKTMQIALASLKQLQTSTDTKLKEQVGSLRVLCMLTAVVPLSGLGDLHSRIQGSVQLHAAAQQPHDLCCAGLCACRYSGFLLLAMCCT